MSNTPCAVCALRVLAWVSPIASHQICDWFDRGPPYVCDNAQNKHTGAKIYSFIVGMGFGLSVYPPQYRNPCVTVCYITYMHLYFHNLNYMQHFMCVHVVSMCVYNVKWLRIKYALKFFPCSLRGQRHIKRKTESVRERERKILWIIIGEINHMCCEFPRISFLQWSLRNARCQKSSTNS